MAILSFINLYIFGTVFPPLLCLFGVFVSVRLDHFLFRHPLTVLRGLMGLNGKRCERPGRGGYSPFRAMMIALAGTLGVGNIVGVSAALVSGGCGALFWIWVSAFATMLIKYTEVTLSVIMRKSRTENGKKQVRFGGPMLYIAKKSPLCAVLFCLLCIGASCAGNLIQMNTASRAVTGIAQIHPVLLAVIIAAVSFFMVFGGRDRIASYSAAVIPVLTVLYCIMCLCVIVRYAGHMPSVLRSVFAGAFTPRAAGGGISAYFILRAMRQGMAKGVYSHEAGCGTAPIAYAGAEADSAPEQGFMGIAEVVIDAPVLCSMTAFAILCVFPDPASSGFSGLALVTEAFRPVFGSLSGILLGVSTAFFAFSTLLSWSFYGSECMRFLFPASKCAVPAYRALFCAVSFASVFLSMDFIWELCDFFTVSMTLLNCGFLLTYLEPVARQTRAYFGAYRAPRQSSGKSHG